ncbi:aspartyl protease family protein [Nitrospirillum amazonense]|uniref:aspartyl protease family protein n=1 Tax=Nitrospirillum amazonense TaxID=28077 RepID=UPI002DD42115|nr:aspartyl protease family protein [Nitrospirillum amazonense]MEC4594373.1 aspartyl protease family protein [Nitrospirillum amazonense]
MFTWLPLEATAAESANAASSCKLLKVGTLPLQMDGNVVLVKSVVNGKPAYFRVVTGSNVSVISVQALAQLGQTTRTKVLAPEYFSLDWITLDSLDLGDWAAKDVRILSGPYGTLSDDYEVVGLLGMDILGKFDVEFDVAHGKIVLYQPQGCETAELAYWSNSYSLAEMAPDPAPRAHIRLFATLNGQQVPAQLASGVSISHLDEALARKLGAEVIPPPDDAAQDPLRGPVAMLDTLALGDEAVRHAKLRIGNLYKQASVWRGQLQNTSYDKDHVPLYLGVDFLKSHRLYVAFSQRKVYFTYEGGAIFQTVGPSLTSGREIDSISDMSVARK